MTATPVKLECPCGAKLETELRPGFSSTAEGIIMAWLSDHREHKP